MQIKKKLVFLAGLSLFCTQMIARAEEPVEKIYIDADHMQLNIETGYSVYTGNVKITQGELKLTGDKVTLQQSNDEIERITVTGKPAHYNHVTEKGENIQAESEHMVYTASQNKLVMTINAKLKQPDHQVSSQKIVYDTKKKIIIAGDKNGSSSDSGSNTNQRVNITLTPKKEPVTE
ncbi:MAG: lipopolysaccharide transport periplasmic protein LptA [Gammaproteobacteria bacterium]|nr:MAG: lipopolysaccharide transport periplasmic protein LptA [Gammaproteobacteria bacterium]